MAQKFPVPDGSTLSIASTYGSPITTTAVSNAAPPVVTAAAHGLADGDIVEVTSGWPDLDGALARVIDAATGTFALEGLNTVDTEKFVAAGGTGSVRKITAWTTIPRPQTISSEGGDPTYATAQALDMTQAVRQATGKNPASVTIAIWNNTSTAGYTELDTADRDGLARAVKMALKGGNTVLYNGTISLNRNPTMTQGQVMTLSFTVDQLQPTIQYAPQTP